MAARALSPSVRAAIAAACVWHMAAVALFALPPEAEGWPRNLQNAFTPLTRPYVLVLSQWQQWNLFSPDPLRRITNYRIEKAIDSAWVTVTSISPKSFPFFERALWIKYLGNAIDTEDATPAQHRFLVLHCGWLDIPSGTRLQLVLERTVLPRNEHVSPVAWWRAFPEKPADVFAASVYCP